MESREEGIIRLEGTVKETAFDCAAILIGGKKKRMESSQQSVRSVLGRARPRRFQESTSRTSPLFTSATTGQGGNQGGKIRSTRP